MEKPQKVNIFTSIFKTIVNREAIVNKKRSEICKCINCKQQVNSNDVYLKFSGEYLHGDCLIDYLQKLRILDVIIPTPDYIPCEAQRNDAKIIHM